MEWPGMAVVGLRLSQLCALGLVLLSYGVMAIHLISLTYWIWLKRRTRLLPEPQHWPKVAVIKPLKGTYEHLLSNLETYFLQDYPKFELSFCVESPDDPALLCVNALTAKYPHVAVRVFTVPSSLGVNPKINNIYKAFESTECDYVWVSDASLQAEPHTLRTMMKEFLGTGPDRIGAVHQLPSVVADHNFGSVVEQVYFATQHAFVYIYADASLDCCVNGMSVLMRKTMVDSRAGGLARYADYLAEDFFLTRALYDSGLRHCLSCVPARQRPSYTALLEVVKRHLRWFRLRRGSLPILSIMEPLSESIFLGLLATISIVYLLPDRIHFGYYFLGHLAVWALIDYHMWRAVHPGKAAAFNRAAAGWALRELGALGMYLVGLRTRVVHWRGRDFIIGKDGKSHLVTVSTPDTKKVKLT